MGEYIKVKLKDLNLWTDNPRISSEKERIENELEVIELIVLIEGRDKMVNLAANIAAYGLNPNKLPTVVYSEQKGNYDLYDGNRRIAAMKSLALNLEYTKDVVNTRNISLETEVLVYCTNREEALNLMEIDHSGEQRGVGQISWDSFRRDLARNQMNKTPMYPRAFQVAQTCNLKLKNFEIIPYTDIESIFNNNQIKKIFDLEESDFTDKRKMSVVIQVLEKYKPESYSRFLPKLKPDSKVYEEFSTKVKNEFDKLIGKLDFSLVKPVIYENEYIDESIIKEVSFDGSKVDLSECQLTLINMSDNLELESFKTNRIGKYKIEITYKGKKASREIEIKAFATPKIALKKGLRVKPRQTYKFVEFIFEAKDSFGKNCDNDVVMEFYDTNNNKITLNDSSKREMHFDMEGVFKIRAIYKDKISNKHASDETIVNASWDQINVENINDYSGGYFKLRLLNGEISFNTTIDNLIIQLNKLYSSKESYLEVIVASLRSLIESLIDFVDEKECNFNAGKWLDKNIKSLYSYMRNEGKLFEYIAKTPISSTSSYHTILNYYNKITEENLDSLASMLNLGAHKSTKFVALSDLKDKEEIISLIIEFTYFYLAWRDYEN